jgi:hypothetical protein
MTTQELTLQLSVYIDELSYFPADIVIQVLQTWPTISKWFPTWHELNDELQWYTNRRQFKIDALLKGSQNIAPTYASIIKQAVRRI